MKLKHKNLMLSDVEKGSNLMSTRLTPQWQHWLILNSSQQPLAVSTQIATFSWHLCNRRDARAESHTHAKRTIIRKKLPTKLNIFALNKTENIYRLFSSDYQNCQTVKLVEKSVAVGGPWYLTQRRNVIYSCIPVSLLNLKKISSRGASLQRGPRAIAPVATP